MFTHAYKGGWIQGWCDRESVSCTDPLGNWLGIFKSYRAGQLAIARSIKSTT